MAVNADKPTRWNDDIAPSVDPYNRLLLAFVPAGAARRVTANVGVVPELDLLVSRSRPRPVAPASDG